VRDVLYSFGCADADRKVRWTLAGMTAAHMGGGRAKGGNERARLMLLRSKKTIFAMGGRRVAAECPRGSIRSGVPKEWGVIR